MSKQINTHEKMIGKNTVVCVFFLICWNIYINQHGWLLY